MRLKDFDYFLPKNLIAQKPVKPRDHSRLLVMDRKTGQIQHEHFFDIINYLRAGDVLVLNNTKVMRARLIGKKAQTGGKVEVFLLKKTSPHPQPLSHCVPRRRGERGEVWQCLIGGKGKKENLQVKFSRGLQAEIMKNNHDGTWDVKFNKSGSGLMKIVEKIGQVPLPPYIKRPAFAPLSLKLWRASKATAGKQESKNYQTVYADDAKLGSVAAPTAGLHFTKELLKKLKQRGVQIEYVTLQVGLGTFAPVKVDDITKHQMHAEWVEVNGKTLANILRAKGEGRRVIAVGTTSARAVESIAKQLKIKNYELKNYLKIQKLKIKNYSSWTDIFIYPGYKFRIVDAMITNFHLPKSTLLMLVSALAGQSAIFKAYQEAIKKKYRFYSYGDAMLIM
ncbi:MAG: tRNA preQ1(34) S-adenosylmethionine ribosyltransferase-isomerase QueA [Patescibacteria group bacterium]|nr:tRNA preQ1(34) S-adenosylmethionine ribosyltransferase-isomerase QueA [Patescibacteria group bacterium]